jgi:hypothetical protein
MEQAAGWIRADIRPLFHEKDAQSMPATFDRSSDDDAKASADKILEKVADGLMPCDRPRAEDQMALFREWVPRRSRSSSNRAPHRPRR